MALEATHIRFALEVKYKYDVQNLNDYLSGAIYPDSRYVTGVPRDMTHPENFLTDDSFMTSDFRKGWFLHLLYDHIQFEVIKEKFPEIWELGYGEQNSEFWIHLSAIKTLQDLEDAKRFDVPAYIKLIGTSETPLGEDANKLRQYYKSIQEVYKNLPNITIEEVASTWTKLGVEKILVEKINEAIRTFSSDSSAVSKISELYDLTLERYKAS